MTAMQFNLDGKWVDLQECDPTVFIGSSVRVRVEEELYHRRRYGQLCECIAFGVDAWREVFSNDTLHYTPVPNDDYIVLYMGLKARIDPGLPPTCFEIT